VNKDVTVRSTVLAVKTFYVSTTKRRRVFMNKKKNSVYRLSHFDQLGRRDSDTYFSFLS